MDENTLKRLNLDNRLRRNTSLTNKYPVVGGLEFDSLYEVQTKRLKASNVEIEDMVRNSNTADVTIGLPDNTTVNLTYTISPKNRFKTNQNMALPYIAVYDGTAAVAGSTIYPNVGGTVTGTAYSVRSGYNYDQAHGTNTAFTVAVTNISGGSRTVYSRGDFVYIQERYGESSN